MPECGPLIRTPHCCCGSYSFILFLSYSFLFRINAVGNSLPAITVLDMAGACNRVTRSERLTITFGSSVVIPTRLRHQFLSSPNKTTYGYLTTSVTVAPQAYFKLHRVAFGKRKSAIHIEIKNASTPAQIVFCQLASLSAKATATMAKKAEIRPNIVSVRNPTSRSMSLTRFSRSAELRTVW